MSVTTALIGRFGNQLFQYCHARAFAEKNGQELRTPRWIGEEIFDIPRTAEPDGSSHVLGGYGQHQEALIYSRRQAREWLKFRPEVEARGLRRCHWDSVAHLRRGDYADCGYVVVTTGSYMRAGIKFKEPDPKFILEENGDDFIQDFYTMMTAPVLFRANSTFSWWAATLGEGTVYSPVIEGLPGGLQECEFVEGNWPRFANLDITTDLRLFTEEDRYDYNLSATDLVIDCGAHEGKFSETIASRYGCEIWAFEPMSHYFDALESRWNGGRHIKLIKAAVGGSERTESFRLRGDSSGLFAPDGDTEFVSVIDILKLVGGHEVALLKLNVEGMEFEILETIFNAGIARQFRNIQVQFHHNAPNAQERYAKIRAALLLTHRTTFDEPWIWINFERR